MQNDLDESFLQLNFILFLIADLTCHAIILITVFQMKILETVQNSEGSWSTTF